MTRGKNVNGQPFLAPAVMKTGFGETDYDMDALKQYLSSQGLGMQPNEYLAGLLKKRRMAQGQQSQPQQQNAY